MKALTLGGDPFLHLSHRQIITPNLYRFMPWVVINHEEFDAEFNADNGVWRVAFAFDPARQAIILVASDKSGVAQKRFYKGLIAKADSRFAEHLKRNKEP